MNTPTLTTYEDISNFIKTASIEEVNQVLSEATKLLQEKQS